MMLLDLEQLAASIEIPSISVPSPRSQSPQTLNNDSDDWDLWLKSKYIVSEKSSDDKFIIQTETMYAFIKDLN